MTEKPKRVARKVEAVKTVVVLEKLKCFPQVDRMVRNGEYARRIGEYIQAQGEYKGVSFEALVSSIRSYRRSLEGGNASAVQDANALNVDDPHYELLVMQDLFRLQKERISMEVETERSLKKLFSTTHKEFEVVERLGSKIMKMKQELNLMGGGMGQSGLPNGKLDIAEVASNPESRQKVLGVVEMIFQDDDLMTDIKDSGGLKNMISMIANKKVPVGEQPLIEVKKPYPPKNKVANKKAVKKKAVKNKLAKHNKARAKRIAKQKEVEKNSVNNEGDNK